MNSKYKWMKIITSCLLLILAWEVYIRFSTLSETEKNSWKFFLEIQEPEGCRITGVQELSWWNTKGTNYLLSISYDMEKNDINKKMRQEINRAIKNRENAKKSYLYKYNTPRMNLDENIKKQKTVLLLEGKK